MRRVAQDEGAAAAIVFGHDAVPGPGLRLKDLEGKVRADDRADDLGRVELFDLGGIDRKPPLVGPVDRGEVGAPVVLQRVNLRHGLSEEGADPVAQPRATEIGRKVVALAKGPDKADTQRLAHRAAPAVTGRKPRAPDDIGFTVRTGDLAVDVIVGLGKGQQFGFIPQVTAAPFRHRAQGRVEGLLGIKEPALG